jgi:uncharacterized OB-fold protein
VAPPGARDVPSTRSSTAAAGEIDATLPATTAAATTPRVEGESLIVPAVPIVDYLVLGDPPHLEAEECTSCGARVFGRHNACPSCSARDFHRVRVAGEGELRTFSIVNFGPPGVPAPYVAAIVDCDGTLVQGLVVNTPPDPEHVVAGMKLRLTTFPIGTDTAGTEAIGFGFEPLEES